MKQASRSRGSGLLVRVMHCIASLAPHTGGTASAAIDLADALAREDHSAIVFLLSQSRYGDKVLGSTPDSRVDKRIAYSNSNILLHAGWPLRRLIKASIPRCAPNLLHNHGVWLPTNHHAAVAARRHGLPLVLHPHGMLEPWALQQHGVKKNVALAIYQRADLEAAALFFATSVQEAESIRKMNLRQPIAIIPNGVAIPMRQSDGVHPRSGRDGRRTALFLSRIHPKKGLLNLIDAWSRLMPVGWRLCLAGPDQIGHLEQVLQRVRMLGLESSVEYVGEVEGGVKAALFESASLFVLPTFSENFGIVVAEALAYGVPVITTHGAPWAGLTDYQCGWWIEPSVEALTDALAQALRMDESTLRQMGERGRSYAKEFDWAMSARQTNAVYHWVLGLGSKPSCVVTD